MTAPAPAKEFNAADLVELLEGVPFPIPAPADVDLPLDPIAYFASGCQRGEVRGFAAIGHDVGVAAPSVNADVEAELLELAGTDVQAFVDSGAFAEFRAQLKGKSSPVPWDKVIALYKRLGAVLGDQLHVVAPDMIGDQGETLRRLEVYAADMRELDAMGVRVLMPVQKGAFTQASFYQRCVDVLGFEPVPALPCKAASTTAEEAAEFVAAVKPTVVHLLGLGPRGHKAKRFLAGIAAACEWTMVQLDSCIIAAHAGKTNGPGGGPRRLTAAAEIVKDMVDAGELAADVQTRKAAGVVLALRDMDPGHLRPVAPAADPHPRTIYMGPCEGGGERFRLEAGASVCNLVTLGVLGAHGTVFWGVPPAHTWPHLFVDLGGVHHATPMGAIHLEGARIRGLEELAMAEEEEARVRGGAA